MAIRATLLATGETIELDNGDQVTLDLLEELRGNCPKGLIECREHDGQQHLAHRWDENGQVHGAWLYVRRLDDRTLLLCHNPHNDPELKSDGCRLRIGKSDQHQLEQDALCALGDRVGYEMSTEHPIRGERGTVVARLDVHGRADDREFGVEVQLSAMTDKTAKARDTKALNAGVPLVWTAKRADAAWTRLNRVAHIATNNLERKAPLEQWRVVAGIRNFTERPCREFRICPTTGSSRDCGQWHALWQADVDTDRELRVADFLERYGDGRLVRLDTKTKQGVVVTEARTATAWLERYALDVPSPRQPREERDRGGHRHCGYGRVDELPSPRRARSTVMPPWADTPRDWAGPTDSPEAVLLMTYWTPGERPKFTCPDCGEPSVEPVHPTCSTEHADWYIDEQLRERSTEPCASNPGLCGSCRGGPCSSGAVVEDHDPLLEQPGVMRAAWWSVCPECGWRINERAVVGLKEVDGKSAWVCRACLTPDLTPTVPEPRAGETTLEVAR